MHEVRCGRGQIEDSIGVGDRESGVGDRECRWSVREAKEEKAGGVVVLWGWIE
jgi:hypothetical protein